MSGAPRKKVVSELSSESSADLVGRYRDMMREAGSPTGAWNPQPDEHLSGFLRHDVSLSPNETKVIAYVTSRCLRPKARGRTIWGWTEDDKPLRATEIAAFFGWDLGNFTKHAKRPLAYGFIRKNEQGQFGVGARVQGQFTEDDPETPTSRVDQLVCTYNLRPYLAEALVASKSEKEIDLFLKTVWLPTRAKYQERLAAEKKRIYEEEQDELTRKCKAFDPNLPEIRRSKPKPESADLYVHTSEPELCTKPENALYNADSGSVRTTYIRRQSKEVNKGDSPAPDRAPDPSEEHACMHALAELRSCFPDHLITDEAIARLHRRLSAELDSYDPAAFVHLVQRRVQNAPKREPIRPGLVFAEKNGLVQDFCSWVQRLKRVEHARTSTAELIVDDPALDRWRQQQEEALLDPAVSDEEKRLIRQCLGIDDPHAKEARRT